MRQTTYLTSMLAAGTLWAATAAAAPFQASTLGNGMQVFVSHTPAAHRTAFSLHSTVGPDDVPCEQQELPHLVEHLLFEGLGPNHDQAAIDLFEGYAGAVNARTTPAAMVLHGYAHSGFAQDAIATIAEAITYRPQVAAAVDREKHLIMREHDLSPLQARFGMAMPAATLLTGRRDPSTCRWDSSLTHLGADDVRALWASMFDPRNLTLYVSSDLLPAEIEAKVAAAFGELPQGGAITAPTPARPVEQPPMHLWRWAGGTTVEVGAVLYLKGDPGSTAVPELTAKLIERLAFDRLRTKGGKTYHVDTAFYPEDHAIRVVTSPSESDTEETLVLLRGAIDDALKANLPPADYESVRDAFALKISSFSEQPELNVAMAVGRDATLRAGVDPVDMSALQGLSLESYRSFVAGWVDGEPQYYVEKRPLSVVPWWLIPALLAVALVLALRRPSPRPAGSQPTP